MESRKYCERRPSAGEAGHVRCERPARVCAGWTWPCSRRVCQGLSEQRPTLPWSCHASRQRPFCEPGRSALFWTSRDNVRWSCGATPSGLPGVGQRLLLSLGVASVRRSAPGNRFQGDRCVRLTVKARAGHRQGREKDRAGKPDARRQPKDCDKKRQSFPPTGKACLMDSATRSKAGVKIGSREVS